MYICRLLELGIKRCNHRRSTLCWKMLEETIIFKRKAGNKVVWMLVYIQFLRYSKHFIVWCSIPRCSMLSLFAIVYLLSGFLSLPHQNGFSSASHLTCYSLLDLYLGYAPCLTLTAKGWSNHVMYHLMLCQSLGVWVMVTAGGSLRWLFCTCALFWNPQEKGTEEHWEANDKVGEKLKEEHR